MNVFTSRLLPFILSLGCHTEAQVTSLYVDFGNSWLRTSGPDAQGHYWTNATQETDQIPGLFDLVGDDGRGTGVSLKLTGTVVFNPWGANASAWGTENPDQSTLGSLAIPSAVWDWLTVTGSQVATITLSKLPPDGSYRLSLVASRDSVQRRVTEYTVSGLTTDSRELQTSGSGIGIGSQPNANRSGVAIFENVSPTADGHLSISVRCKEGDAGYLGAMRLELMSPANFAPAATEVRTAGSGRVGFPQTGRYVFKDRDGDPEGASTCFWERASSITASPVRISESGAGGSVYIPTSQDQGAYVRFGVVPRAANGFVEGTVIYSNWVGPIASTDTFASFHIGSSYTQWANIPLQLKNLSASRGVKTLTGWQATSGQNSRYHWENGLNGLIGAGTYSRHELVSGSWDAVVLQPYNSEWQPAQIAQAQDYAKRFYSLADSRGTQFYFYAGWPSRSQSIGTQASINAAFETLRSSVSIGGSKPALIIPSGEAFKAVIQEAESGYLKSFNVNHSLDRVNWYLDDLHPNDLGAYVSVLTHYATLMKRSPVGLPAQALDANFYNDNPVSLDPALCRRIQEIVWWVVANYPNSGVSEVVAKPVDSLTQPSDANLPPPVYITHVGGAMDPALLALAFGVSSDGVSANSSNLPHPTSPMAPGKIEIEYVINPDAESQQVTFTPEWSENLVQWTQVQPALTVITRTNQTVRVSWPNTSRWRFIRLYVSKP